jgi:hypothetical protein
MMYRNLKRNEASSNLCGAMETETIQKNGASLKSLMSKGNAKIEKL